MKDIIQSALHKGHKALSEYDSKRVIGSLGISVTREGLAHSLDEATALAEKYGYPVVLKGCSHALTHKTEHGMVKLNLKSSDDVRRAYGEITGAGMELDGVLVQEMVKGDREFVMGLSRDPQFGPCVMFGMGGVYTEVMNDVAFRVAPITRGDAEEMLDEIRMKELLDEFRGSPAVDRESIITALVEMGNLACATDEIAEIDVNPIIIAGNKPVVVDALIILKG
jgi:succinyl-CoA synthetase beta subunit